MMIIPPFAGVTLVEYRDHFELTPYQWIREFVGLGRFKASEVGPEPGGPSYPFFHAMIGEGEIWVVARWQRSEDGHEEVLNLNYLDAGASEAQAKEAYESMVRFAAHTKAELEKLTSLFKASEDDLAYVENRFPGVSRGAPDAKAIDDWDVYQARLRVLAGLQPNTVALMHKAESTEDPQERERIEREVIQAYFAEMAHTWTEDLVIEWQRNNPVGTQWLCEFGRVLQEPERRLDEINQELALNWLHRKYNLLTEEELSDAILVATGQRLMPGTLKKRRERLGLTTKRPTGPRPKSEQ